VDIIYTLTIATTVASPAKVEPVLLRSAEVATLLGISKAQVHNLINDGTLPSLRFAGKSVRVPRRALMDWIEKRTRPAA
jgi:excisionase family DNA binding protein